MENQGLVSKVGMSFERGFLGAWGTPRAGREEMPAANLGAPRRRAGRFMGCLCAAETLAGKQANSSWTTLCFEINLNGAAESVLRLYKCFFFFFYEQ